MTLDRVAIVMVTYASVETAPAALGALPVHQLGPVVVVDNASPDATVVEVARLGLPIQIVANDANVGFGAAVNRGLASVHGCEYVLVLNPDASIAAPNLHRLVSYLDGEPRCGMVGPRLFRDGVALTSCGRAGSLWTELRTVAPARIARRLPDRRFPAGFNGSGPVGYIEGACMLVRRRALEAAGGFDERYFLFYEELDLAQRLRAAGYTVDFLAEARAEHVGGVSRRAVAFAARPEFVRSATKYVRRWSGPSAAFVYRATASTVWRWRRRQNRIPRAEAAALLEAVRVS